jgi:hypothetical protein
LIQSGGWRPTKEEENKRQSEEVKEQRKKASGRSFYIEIPFFPKVKKSILFDNLGSGV